MTMSRPYWPGIICCGPFVCVWRDVWRFLWLVADFRNMFMNPIRFELLVRWWVQDFWTNYFCVWCCYGFSCCMLDFVDKCCSSLMHFCACEWHNSAYLLIWILSVFILFTQFQKLLLPNMRFPNYVSKLMLEYCCCYCRSSWDVVSVSFHNFWNKNTNNCQTSKHGFMSVGFFISI